MISYNEISELFDQNVIKSLGFSKEQFASLPEYYRKALLKSFIEINKEIIGQEELKKRTALKQYDREEEIRQKVLSIFKK